MVERLMASDDLKLIQDQYDQHLKSASYLLAAHAAGLAGCLTVLKDYANTPQLRGLGIFVMLFGVGLIAAILNYISLVFARGIAVNVQTGQTILHEPTRDFVANVHLIAVGLSLLALLIAIITLMVKFASL